MIFDSSYQWLIISPAVSSFSIWEGLLKQMLGKQFNVVDEAYISPAIVEHRSYMLYFAGCNEFDPFWCK